MKKLVLVGGGGHCKSVIDVLLELKTYDLEGIIDPKLKIQEKILGVPVIGNDNDIERIFFDGTRYCLITVGSVGSSATRTKLYSFVKKAGFTLPVIISGQARVSRHALIGEGSFVAPGAIVNAGAVIGNNCIINTGAVIDHDCKIGDHVHIAPGAVLSGGVNVGNSSHIGAGSTVIQYLEIGSNAVIGAGSVVTKNIAANIIAYGNYCKEIRKNNG